MNRRPDPYEVAAWHFFSNPDAPGAIEHRLRMAVNAAIITDRRRTLAYWLCRWRQKLIWFGGWELPNCGGWDLRKISGHGIQSPMPVTVASVFTHYGWGWQLKLPGTILVRSKPGGSLYFSPDGTPRSATRWLIGKEYGA